MHCMSLCLNVWHERVVFVSLFFFFFYYTIQAQYASILKLNRIGFYFFGAIFMKVCDGLLENTQSTICVLHIQIIEIPFHWCVDCVIGSMIDDTNQKQQQMPAPTTQKLYSKLVCYSLFAVNVFIIFVLNYSQLYDNFFFSFVSIRVLVSLFPSQQIQILC